MAIAFNALETNRFGIRCARVVDADTPIAEIDREARAQNIQFLSVRVQSDAISLVQALEDGGFRLMDTLVYYNLLLEGACWNPKTPNNVHIREAMLVDAESVGALAGAAFTGFFGHFHADERLSKDAADAVYVDWAISTVHAPEVTVLVAEIGQQSVGFLSAKGSDTGVADITLNAVHPNWQRAGVYGALLDDALMRLQAEQYSEVTISTQVNNIPVQKTWAKRGFRMQKSFYTLHKWMDDQNN